MYLSPRGISDCYPSFVSRLSAASYYRLPTPFLMRHHIHQHIDPHGVRFLHGELVEVVLILAFAFTPIAQIVVVAQEGHQAAVLVEVRPKMWQLVAGGAAVPMLEFEACTPRPDVHDLREFLKIEDGMEYRMRQRQL